VAEVHDLFRNAPFRWGLAGGYAVEQFVGAPIREHGDIDIIVYRDDQHRVYEWLNGWSLYAADPPGTLRIWSPTEWLAVGIHDIWGHRADAEDWQLQIMLVESDGSDWVSRRHPMIRGSQADLIVEYRRIPCIRIDVQLLYKAKSNREKDRQDFHACLPKLSVDAKEWLKQALRFAHPEGHPWHGLL
jgi:hypothetical protein